MEQKEYLDYDGLKRYHKKLLTQYPQLESVSIESMPTKLTYAPGDSFDPSGMVVKVNYSDGTNFVVSDYSIDPEVIENDTASVSIIYSSNGITKTVSIPITVIHIYGVEWDWENGSSTKGVRTDASANFSDPNPAVNNGTGSSPFDILMPWAGMTKETRAGGIEVKEPKYWFKWTKTGKKLKIQVADGAVDGFHVDPVNMDRGDGLGELDFSYIGRYHCVSETYRSETNKLPQGGISIDVSRVNIHNLGSSFWQMDFAQFWYIGMLYLVEFADWDSQKTIGNGCGFSSSINNNGKTDAMQYHTGTTEVSRDTYGYTQYRNIEGWWDNIHDWIDGCGNSNSEFFITLNPNQFGSSENRISIGSSIEGYPSDFTIPEQDGLEWALIPCSANGNSNMYDPDRWGFVNDNNGGALCHGGKFSNYGLEYGAFYIRALSWWYSSYDAGCRLQERPPKEVQA